MNFKLIFFIAELTLTGLPNMANQQLVTNQINSNQGE